MRTTSFCATIVLFVVATAVPAAHAASDTEKATMLIARTEVLSQQLASAAHDAVGGNVDAFANLKKTRDAIAECMTRLDGYADRLAPKTNFGGLDVEWAQLSSDVTKLLESQEQIAGIAEAAGDINGKLPVLNSRMDEVVNTLAKHPDSAIQVMIASRLMLLADRMQRRMPLILNGDEGAESAAMGLQRDAQFYSAVLEGLLKGNKDLDLKPMGNAIARDILKDINTQWTGLAPTVTKVLDAAADVQAARRAADKVAEDALTVLIKGDALMSRINE
jgi:twitching motility protein PilJ